MKRFPILKLENNLLIGLTSALKDETFRCDGMLSNADQNSSTIIEYVEIFPESC